MGVDATDAGDATDAICRVGLLLHQLQITKMEHFRPNKTSPNPKKQPNGSPHGRPSKNLQFRKEKSQIPVRLEWHALFLLRNGVIRSLERALIPRPAAYKAAALPG